MLSHQELVLFCEQRMQKGSKSFSFASKIFSKETYQDVLMLYSWCRYADDVIDGQELGFHQSIPGDQKTFEELKFKTIEAFQKGDDSNPIFQAFHYVMKKYSIPIDYPLDLLKGMQWDAEGRDVKTEEELLLYCYYVAGVVGLMMTHIMGTKSSEAFPFAQSMGNAMQLTNISRDIVTDARVKRCYIPKTWLKELNLTILDLLNPIHEGKIKSLSTRLLDLADFYYQEGDKGLKYLSFQSAFTIASARFIYWKIGDKIRHEKNYPMSKRVGTSKMEKIFLIVKAFFLTLKTRIR
jgi:phytoene synthase